MHISICICRTAIERNLFMSFLSENLKVLLWKSRGELSQKSYGEYVSIVASRCGMTAEHFRAVLRDKESVTNQELTALRSFFADYSDNLSALEYDYLFIDLVNRSKENILEKNLQYLFGTLEYGENAEFVEAIGVNPSTLTRWKQGKTKPDKYAQTQIARYFGFRDAEDLMNQFLFLGLEPVSTQQKKQHCIKLIDEMSKEDFEAIFVGLQKLLN